MRFKPLLPVAARCLTLWLCLWAAAPASARAQAPQPALVPIASLDVARYMGTWHQVALYPNWFQRRCVSDTVARYTALPGARVEVLNRCRNAAGEMIEALGEAQHIGAADSPRLKVRFAPAWLSWLPLVWGDYWVIDLDPAYSLVAVSEPSREYLWVLSRSPQPDPAAYDALLGRLQAMGFDLKRLERTAPR